MQWVLLHSDLTDFDKVVFSTMTTFADLETGIVNMAAAAIAKKMGASRNGVHKSIRRLMKVGAVNARVSAHRQYGKWHVRLGHLQGREDFYQPDYLYPSEDTKDADLYPSGEHHRERAQGRLKKQNLHHGKNGNKTLCDDEAYLRETTLFDGMPINKPTPEGKEGGAATE